MNITEELKAYREGVDTLFSLQSSKMISNGKPGHAAILYEAFFKNAKDSVSIFCNNLNKEVFSNDIVIHAAKTAVARGVAVRILTQKPESELESSEFVETLTSGCNCNLVEIKQVSMAGDQELQYNFAIMDDLAFRFEENRDKLQATASMHRPEIAKKLLTVFDRMHSTVQ